MASSYPQLRIPNAIFDTSHWSPQLLQGGETSSCPHRVDTLPHPRPPSPWSNLWHNTPDCSRTGIFIPTPQLELPAQPHADPLARRPRQPAARPPSRCLCFQSTLRSGSSPRYPHSFLSFCAGKKCLSLSHLFSASLAPHLSYVCPAYPTYPLLCSLTLVLLFLLLRCRLAFSYHHPFEPSLSLPALAHIHQTTHIHAPNQFSTPLAALLHYRELGSCIPLQSQLSHSLCALASCLL